MSEPEIILDMAMGSVVDDIRQRLYQLVIKDKSEEISKLCRNRDYDFTLPLNPSKDTVFHVAAKMGSVKSLRAIFKMVPDHSKEEVLTKTNIYGNTPIHELVAANNAFLEEDEDIVAFLAENEGIISREMLEIHNDMGETPLYRAAAYGNIEIVKWLTNLVGENPHKHFTRDFDDHLPILHIAVINGHFEIAIWLLRSYPELAKEKDSGKRTCLRLLAAMPSAFKSSSSTKMTASEVNVYNKLTIPDDFDDGDVQRDHNNQRNEKQISWAFIRRLADLKNKHFLAVELVKILVKKDGDSSWSEPNKTNENGINFFSKYETEAEDEEEEAKKKAKNRGGAPMATDTPLITATWSGIVEIVKEILEVYPQAIEHVTENGQNILHVAVLSRHDEIFELIKKTNHIMSRLLAQGIDNYGDTVLHKVGYITYHAGRASKTADFILLEELRWFNVRKVKDLYVSEHYRIHRNKNNFTADELFKKEHEGQLKQAQEWVKNACQSFSTVAVLVVTVLYTVAFQVPGGYISDGDEKGHPVLLKHPLYSFFTVMDVSGLATSLTSVIIFVTILNSPMDQDSFGSNIPPRLHLGFIFLYLSIVTTMFSFMATILLTVTLKMPGTMALNFIASFIPITIYHAMQYKSYYEYIIITRNRIYNLFK